jgi:hypothetical protein
MPGGNGMSSNRMRRLHSKTHPLIAAMRYVGDTKRRSLGFWPPGAGFSPQPRKLITQRSQLGGLQQRV